LSCFVDASAVVAILGREPERALFLQKLDEFKAGRVSPIVMYESCLAVSRLLGVSVLEAEDIVATFVRDSNLEVCSIDSPTASMALQAFRRFGKGRHKASLNMGDCFAYACAKVLRVPLLCKGEDFIHTDIRIA
jgi:ribonuclease VapC